jgi:hypothetical protein
MIHYYISDCGAFKVHANYPGYVGRENNTFETNDVKNLIIKGFKTITPEKWTNFVIMLKTK